MTFGRFLFFLWVCVIVSFLGFISYRGAMFFVETWPWDPMSAVITFVVGLFFVTVMYGIIQDDSGGY